MLLSQALRMTFIHQAFSIGQIFNPIAFLKDVGPFAIIVIIVIVFIESGLLFPFLPGDSLVFAAALLSTTLRLPLWILIPVVAATAVAGGHTGYAIGARIGPRLFKPDARIFTTKYHDQADAFVEKYGAAAIVLARFVPIVRTYVPPLVGMSPMSVRKFAVWNAVGAVAWAIALSLAGYFLGKVPFVVNNIELIAVLIVLVSVLPVVIGRLVQSGRERRRERATTAIVKA
jgi:membrane-associated protein